MSGGGCECLEADDWDLFGREWLMGGVLWSLVLGLRLLTEGAALMVARTATEYHVGCYGPLVGVSVGG
jgi:hypothetical protein